MTKKELPNPKKKDRDWQEKIAKSVEKENVELNHPHGLERFKKTIAKAVPKKSKNQQ